MMSRYRLMTLSLGMAALAMLMPTPAAADRKNNGGHHRTEHHGHNNNNHRGNNNGNNGNHFGNNKNKDKHHNNGNHNGWKPQHVKPNKPGHSYAPPAGHHHAAKPVVLSPHRWKHSMPPPPPRRVHVVHHVPSIGSILGLTFGSLVDAGLSALTRGGYDVVGYQDGNVYLQNVSQLGYVWPSVTMGYVNGALSNAQFQYWSAAADAARYNALYNQLVRTYGQPYNRYVNGGVTTVSWWGGSNRGYVTLQYGPGYSYGGSPSYYTNLIYGSAY